MITIRNDPQNEQWHFRLTCSMPRCHALITGSEPSADEVHAVIEEQPWMRNVNLGAGFINADLCPQHATNFKAGGRQALPLLQDDDHKYEPGAFGVCLRCGKEEHPGPEVASD